MAKNDAPEKDYRCTDDANAERLVKRLHSKGLDYLYAVDEKLWWKYGPPDGDGPSTHWQRDIGNSLIEEAKRIGRDIEHEFRGLQGDDYMRLFRWARASEQSPRLKAMCALAASVPGMWTETSKFDRSDRLLNCPNGTLDLKTGELLPHSPEDLITKCTAVDYDRGAGAPRWETLLERVLPDKSEREHLQRALGYSLSGDAGQRKMWILVGQSGANGKSALCSIVRQVLGSYAADAAIQTFLDSGRPKSGPNPEMVALQGTRFITLSEPSPGVYWDSGDVKKFTGGGDEITCRSLYSNQIIHYRPQGKLIVACNTTPGAKDTGALLDRMIFINFNVQIPLSERIPDFDRQVFTEEGPGILAWMVRGWERYLDEGLAEPASCIANREEQRAENDDVRRFIAEALRPDDSERSSAGDVHAAYLEWAKLNGSPAYSQKTVSQRLKKAGLNTKKVHGSQYFCAAVALPFQGIGWKAILERVMAGSEEDAEDVATEWVPCPEN